MDLAGKHVLVDGDNLQLMHGTGIKTYALTLVRTLVDLGARVSILWSSRFCATSVDRESLLYKQDQQKKRSWLENVGAMGRVAAHVLVSGRTVNAGGQGPSKQVASSRANDNIASLVHRYYFIPRDITRLFSRLGMSLQVKVPDQVDFWHATYPLLIGVKGARSVISIHDLIPLKLPWTCLDNRRFFRNSVKQSLDRSDLVITVSENTKQDLVEMFNVDPERVRVTYQPLRSVSPDLSEEAIDALLASYGLRNKEYFLFVGAIEPKKNIKRLARAVKSLRLDIPLVLVGKKAWLWEGELQKTDGLILLDFVPTEHLQCLYKGALFFVFPSLYEGFGLPPLEAMAHGCPVITSNVSSLPEVCGAAALYVDPYNVSDIAEKIQCMYDDPGLRQRLSEQGRERARFFSMENYRKRLSDAYSILLD
ncbi:MAG: glycosyltransferase [Desulfobacterales bacterium]|nr:glycosyltransferase [Desulfobacterales bacterium]